MVLTDYFGGHGYMNADQAIRNGNDIMLSPNEHKDGYVQDITSATSIIAMRRASHNIMYTVANSNVYDDHRKEIKIELWSKIQKIMNITSIMVLLGIQALAIIQYRKKKELAE